MTWPRALPWMVLILLAGAVLGGVPLPGWLGGDGAAGELEPQGTVAATLERVIDGDTIVAQVGGREERVRYIGVDTPETVKPDTPVQCYGPAAHDRNAQLLGRAGTAIVLRFDRELRDRYGRLLAYVYRDRDDLLVNAQLVRDGAARTLEISPNTAHAAELRQLESGAQSAARGLWGACGAP